MAWEDPRPGWVGLGWAQLGAGHSNAQYSNLYPKLGLIREGKTAYMAKPYGTLSEHES